MSNIVIFNEYRKYLDTFDDKSHAIECFGKIHNITADLFYFEKHGYDYMYFEKHGYDYMYNANYIDNKLDIDYIIDLDRIYDDNDRIKDIVIKIKNLIRIKNIKEILE